MGITLFWVDFGRTHPLNPRLFFIMKHTFLWDNQERSRDCPYRMGSGKPSLVRLTPFRGQDLSLLLRKRSIEVDLLARSGPDTDTNAGACKKTPANIRVHSFYT